MNLQNRILLMSKLGDYLNENTDEYQAVKEKAHRENAWFTPEFTSLATKNIAGQFLDKTRLEEWVNKYAVPQRQASPKKIGIVMAGNIPLVGFHDMLCVFISGHKAIIKASAKDSVLIRHLVAKLTEWDAAVTEEISFAEQLKDCDAYIATGSNNSGRYFEYYFGRYPHIIRYNRTSAAVLDGTESLEELGLLADDICLYFGLGCRNITKLCVPANYDFVPLLSSLKRYHYFLDHHKYKNNYDYHLALLIMGNKFYMTDGTTLLAEDPFPFSPVSQVNYEYYEDKEKTIQALKESNDIQAVAGHGLTPFGQAQQPALHNYADGIDTMRFLLGL